jgi:hypothetical protein
MHQLFSHLLQLDLQHFLCQQELTMLMFLLLQEEVVVAMTEAEEEAEEGLYIAQSCQ